MIAPSMLAVPMTWSTVLTASCIPATTLALQSAQRKPKYCISQHQVDHTRNQLSQLMARISQQWISSQTSEALSPAMFTLMTKRILRSPKPVLLLEDYALQFGISQAFVSQPIWNDQAVVQYSPPYVMPVRHGKFSSDVPESSNHFHQSCLRKLLRVRCMARKGARHWFHQKIKHAQYLHHSSLVMSLAYAWWGFARTHSLWWTTGRGP